MIEWDERYAEEEVTIKRKGGVSLKPPPSVEVTVAANGMKMWEKLFPFPLSEVQDFFTNDLMSHLAIRADGFAYKWPHYEGAEKLRPIKIVNGRKHYWSVTSTTTPPLWPEVDEELPEEIYFAEGETDCIVARWIGLHAYALTKGADTHISEKIIRSLSEKGVRRIYLLFDDDEAGHTAASEVRDLISSVSMRLPKEGQIECRILSIADILLPLYGEKDLRQAALRLKDQEALAEAIQEIKVAADAEKIESPWTTGHELLDMPIPPIPWMIRDVLSPGGFSLITGFAKMGKSYIALDIAMSIATGSPFLNHFPVDMIGDVLYVAKETTDYGLQERYRKMRPGKGNLVSVSRNGEPIPLTSQPDVHFDLSRTFRFDPPELATLQKRVLEFQAKTERPIRLIIIDPFSYCIPSGKFDINSYIDVQKSVVIPSKMIAHETGAAVLVIQHQSKGEGSTALGSMAWEGAFDNKISYLDKERQPNQPIRLAFTHRDASSFSIEFEPGVSAEIYAPQVLGSAEQEITIKKTSSYADRQKATEAIILALAPEDREFTWKELEAIIRETHSDMKELPTELLSNTFTYMRKTSKTIRDIKTGVYMVNHLVSDDEDSGAQ